jgi:Ca2+-binding EF-hand superfamily protein
MGCGSSSTVINPEVANNLVMAKMGFHNLPKPTQEKYRKLFDTVKVSESDRVNLDEMLLMFKKAFEGSDKAPPTDVLKQGCEAFMKTCDIDKDGRISFEMAIMGPIHRAMEAKENEANPTVESSAVEFDEEAEIEKFRRQNSRRFGTAI